jgi:uncharacterized membrane protein YdjX (TVP38/TMEM64 family)
MDDATAQTAQQAENRSFPIGKIVVGLGALAALVLLAQSAGDAIPAFATWVDELGPWGPIAFMIGYALSIVAFVPASLLTLAAGAIFGVAAGTFYVFIGATIGAAVSFLISRYLARSAIERKLQGNEKFSSIDRAVGEQGRKIVFLLRLSPIFPFGLLNYALGLTRVRFSDYIVASIGMIPATLLYVYAGKAASEVAALAGGAEIERDDYYYALLTVGLLATLVATVIVTRIARRALAEATEGSPNQADSMR